MARPRLEKVVERIAQPSLFQVFKEENGWKSSTAAWTLEAPRYHFPSRTDRDIGKGMNFKVDDKSCNVGNKTREKAEKRTLEASKYGSIVVDYC